VYGIQVRAQNDPYVRAVENTMSGVEALVTGAYLVDLFPIRGLFRWNLLLYLFILIPSTAYTGLGPWCSLQEESKNVEWVS
jgi:hypothetical protein